MSKITSNIYKKKDLPFIEQSSVGLKHTFIMYELTPPDKLIALLKENKFDVRVSGYASEDQWEGYKVEIVKLKSSVPEKGVSFLLNDNNLFVKGYPMAHGDVNVVFYIDSED